MKEKLVLAYSGGLDTSVAIKWLQDKYGVDVVAVAVDVGEEKNYEEIREKALKIGAASAYVIDAKEEFARDFILPALKANALYEGRYPLSAALSRPLIAKKVVEIAKREGAKAVAHGSTGKGNDQVRFEVSFMALAPDLKIVAPVREWNLSREEEIEYARKFGIPVPVKKEKPYSIDVNLWGRSIECGPIEDVDREPPEDAFLWTVSPRNAPNEPQYIDLEFKEGEPIALNGEQLSLPELISRLNEIGGRHGIGRIDMVENRLVGIKSREVYEAPAATILITAHKDLESLTLSRELLHFKQNYIDTKYAELIYYGLWFSHLRDCLDGFIKEAEKFVTGKVRLKLFKGSCSPVGRSSPYSLYDISLATYGEGDIFDQRLAEGFVQLWGLPYKIEGRRKRE
ncbi:argininosuccinate synthase [bacterium]|nr:argininosuccinate synthase [bacterium]